MLTVKRSKESTFAFKKLFTKNDHPDIVVIRNFVNEEADVPSPSSELQDLIDFVFVICESTPIEAKKLLGNNISINRKCLFEGIWENTIVRGIVASFVSLFSILG